MVELERRPPVAMPEPPARFAPPPPRPPALALQLGIRPGAYALAAAGPPTRLEDYGPTSHLDEDLLWRGYGLDRRTSR